jgi:hypothetical protein
MLSSFLFLELARRKARASRFGIAVRTEDLVSQEAKARREGKFHNKKRQREASDLVRTNYTIRRRKIEIWIWIGECR